MEILDKWATEIFLSANTIEQLNFLRVYPMFGIDQKRLVDLWIDTYHRCMIDEILIENLKSFIIIGLSHNYLEPDESRCLILMEIFRNLGTSYKLLESRQAKLKSMISDFRLPKFITPVSTIKQSRSLSLSLGSKLRYSRILAYNLKLFDGCRILDNDIKILAAIINLKYTYLFNKLTPHEIINRSLDCNYPSPTLVQIFNLFDKLSSIVPNEILVKCKSKSDRINSINKFITLAENFLDMRNYEAFFAIISGLCHSSISRIKSLWHPGKKHTKKFLQLETIIQHDGGYQNYRNIIPRKEKCIPYMGLILADINHCAQMGIIDVDKKQINLACYHSIVEIINKYIKQIPIIDPIIYAKTDKTILEEIDNYIILDENELYELSVKIFPLAKMAKISYKPRPKSTIGLLSAKRRMTMV